MTLTVRERGGLRKVGHTTMASKNNSHSGVSLAQGCRWPLALDFVMFSLSAIYYKYAYYFFILAFLKLFMIFTREVESKRSRVRLQCDRP